LSVAGDWISAERVDRYVRGLGEDATAEAALRGFGEDASGEGTTPWLWRNVEVAAFVDWLRDYNATVDDDRKCGFVGLDLFSLDRSAAAVVRYLESVDPGAAARARDAYAPFLHAAPGDYARACGLEARADARAYAAHVAATADGCERVLAALQAARYEYWDVADAADQFAAEQNAEVVVSAQQFYAKRHTEPDVT